MKNTTKIFLFAILIFLIIFPLFAIKTPVAATSVAQQNCEGSHGTWTNGSCNCSGLGAGWYLSSTGSCLYKEPTPSACSDGTYYNKCSTVKPKYCRSGSLVDNCGTCGCPSSGQTCQSSGSCTVKSTCSDGTQNNSCSATKPKYCQNGYLNDTCAICGCPSGQICQTTSGSCITQSSDSNSNSNSNSGPYTYPTPSPPTAQSNCESGISGAKWCNGVCYCPSYVTPAAGECVKGTPPADCSGNTGGATGGNTNSNTSGGSSGGGTTGDGSSGGGSNAGIEPGAVTSVEIPNPIGAKDFGELINAVINFFFYLGLIVVPLTIVIAGIFMMTAGGEPERVNQAKRIIWYSALGLFIVLFAKGIISIINNILGVKK